MAGGERHGIEAATGKRMAAQQSPQSQSGAPKWAVDRDRRRSILRAGWLKLAAAGSQRMQGRRKPAFVESEQSEQDARHRTGFEADVGYGVEL